MEKLIDALIANAAANVAVLVLIIVVFILLGLMQQQRKDHAATGEKLAAAVHALADALQQLRIDFASRGIKR